MADKNPPEKIPLNPPLPKGETTDSPWRLTGSPHQGNWLRVVNEKINGFPPLIKGGRGDLNPARRGALFNCDFGVSLWV